ncbi:MAG: FAD-dependent oxidoreductase [Actinomycetota bacterium]|nr:FAD-dependent oxidoreductase [Actinomycetota bacterium]
MPDKFNVLIIGAGISGLSAASLLSKRGLKVAVIDRNFKPGGSCGIFKRNEYTFDQGTAMLYGFGNEGFNPHRFLFNCLEETFYVIKHKILYSVKFKGRKIKFFADVDKFVEELSIIFPTQKKNLKKFYSDMKNLYSKVIIKKPAYETPDETNRILALKKLLSNPISYIKFLSFMNKSTKELLEKYFDDPELFKFFDKLTSTYCYTTVSETPAILSAIMFIDNHVGGSFYPAGSTLFLPGKLEKVIEENGGEMIFDSEVKKILFKNKKAIGVLLEDGEEIYAENIIYSGTVWNLYKNLVDKEYSRPERREWAQKMAPTYPSMVFYAAVDSKVLPAGTDPIEMIIGNPDSIDESEITVYMLSIDDKTLCPERAHVLAAIGPSFKKWPPGSIKTDYRSPDYMKQKEVEEERIKNVLEKHYPGFKEGLIYSEISSPSTIEKYTMKNDGCVAGPKQSIGQHMFNRLHVKSDWESLFCCGESCTMGTGSPAVTVSGISAANAVLREYGKKEFLYEPGMKNYIRVMEKPVINERLYASISKSVREREIIMLANECLFCEEPECMKSLNLDIRGIMRRISVGNFHGAGKIVKRFFKNNEIGIDELRKLQDSCIKSKKGVSPVQIVKIIEFFFKHQHY